MCVNWQRPDAARTRGARAPARRCESALGMGKPDQAAAMTQGAMPSLVFSTALLAFTINIAASLF
jgi:hypothetical protein